MMQIKEKRSDCPIAGTLDLVGDRWTLLIIRDILMCDKHIYSDFAASEECMPTNILADRLKRLEALGIVQKLPYQENPPRYEYQLTERGLALSPVLDEIVKWGRANLPDIWAENTVDETETA
jgi:DNA-binding HxlR family transcriptional regulator